MRWTRRFGHYSLVLRAAALLLAARLLVAAVPMRYWRGSLGTILGNQDADIPRPTSWADVPAELRYIASAVERASRWLPLHLRCLPRAMAVQWMARRRGMNCTLRIGLERGATEELHAWVDYGQVTITGNLPGRSFVHILAIRSVRT